MPNARLAFAVPLALLIAACGDRGEPTPNETGRANASGNEAGADASQANASATPADDPLEPPDAVSHPDGYLPYGNEAPPSSGPEPTGNFSGSKEPPPATEDEYIRNKQAGG